MPSPTISNQAASYIDTVWLLMITFLTVGYGDFFPVTLTGRAIAVVTVLVGQVYAAMIIGIVHTKLKLTDQDITVFNILENKYR